MKSVFENLFVLELANNHWGSLSRGKEIVKSFAKVVKNNNVKASIKLQFRDVDNFIHPNHKHDNDRYIQKTIKIKLSFSEFKTLINFIKSNDCIPMATPFDEKSVELCEELNSKCLELYSKTTGILSSSNSL